MLQSAGDCSNDVNEIATNDTWREESYESKQTEPENEQETDDVKKNEKNEENITSRIESGKEKTKEEELVQSKEES